MTAVIEAVILYNGSVAPKIWIMLLADKQWLNGQDAVANVPALVIVVIGCSALLLIARCIYAFFYVNFILSLFPFPFN